MKAATPFQRERKIPFRISIHAAREGGDLCARVGVVFINISIHAAREGGDENARGSKLRNRISIHAAREGGDLRVRTCA